MLRNDAVGARFFFLWLTLVSLAGYRNIGGFAAAAALPAHRPPPSGWDRDVLAVSGGEGLRPAFRFCFAAADRKLRLETGMARMATGRQVPSETAIRVCLKE
jgi:hypothetical protein